MEEWREEKRRWEEKSRRIEKRMEEIERWEREKSRKEGLGEKGRRRLREVELKMDKREREGRRRNLVIRGINMGGKGVEEEVKELWRKMELKKEIEAKEVRKIGREDSKGRGMILIKLESLEVKKRVMEAKKKLRGGRERIEDDLTVEIAEKKDK